jgi:hypothetical protein
MHTLQLRRDMHDFMLMYSDIEAVTVLVLTLTTLLIIGPNRYLVAMHRGIDRSAEVGFGSSKY